MQLYQLAHSFDIQHVVRQWATDTRTLPTTPMFLNAKSTAYNDEWWGCARRVIVSGHKADPWRDLLTSQRTKLNTIIAVLTGSEC
jgi:hypothetical protein